MDMEVMIPTAASDFNFDSACTTPYMSAPSSPQRFGTFFFSAPTSPTRVSAFYNEFNSFRGHPRADGSLSSVPFDWEEKPGIPKGKDIQLGNVDDDDDDDDDDDHKDFAFDFSGQLEMSSVTADELFDGGKIKPLKPPPRLQYDGKSSAEISSPKSPRSPKQMIKDAFSPRHRKKDLDPFAAALEETRKSVQDPANDNQERGRGRTCGGNTSSTTARKKGRRSLSPFRVSDLLLDRDPNNAYDDSSSSSLFSTSYFASFWYKKWKLKDLLLFRSASEGHATTKEQFKKYSMLKKTTQQGDVKSSSFRSVDSGGSVSSSRRRGPVSAHELHYTANRAMAKEMSRKTSLPYKPGLFGCLGFNPGGSINDTSRSFGSMAREHN